MRSKTAPEQGETAFLNYCVGKQDVLFSVSKLNRSGQIPFGDTIIFPPPNSRVDGLLNVLLSNEMIGRIASIRAFITKAAVRNEPSAY
jgi:hypothetical protein